jgi:uncharacterized protein with FMN-binding domain
VKRWLWLVLALLVAAGCGVPTKPDTLGAFPDGRLTDGVYRGRASHFPAKAVVEVEVVDGRVADVRLVEHRYGRGGPAGERIPERILYRRSTDVDAVSGATGSSILIMEAVQSALEKAQ